MCEKLVRGLIAVVPLIACLPAHATAIPESRVSFAYALIIPVAVPMLPSFADNGMSVVNEDAFPFKVDGVDFAGILTGASFEVAYTGTDENVDVLDDGSRNNEETVVEQQIYDQLVGKLEFRPAGIFDSRASSMYAKVYVSKAR